MFSQKSDKRIMHIIGVGVFKDYKVRYRTSDLPAPTVMTNPDSHRAGPGWIAFSEYIEEDQNGQTSATMA